VHIAYLIGFDNKLLVLFQWAWNYVTRKRGAQLTQLPPSYIVWQEQHTCASSLACILARGESVGGDRLQRQR